MTLYLRTLIEDDWDQIKEIYLEGIATGNATFETATPSKVEWFSTHIIKCSIACLMGESVLGWAALSSVSSRSVYFGVAEVSIYVKHSNRGQGIGSLLMNRIIEESEKNGFWMLQSGIFPDNYPSLKLHDKHGFRVVGTRERIGKMSNNIWRDVLLLERRSQHVGVE